jgi:hypothetical protein
VGEKILERDYREFQFEGKGWGNGRFAVMLDANWRGT